MSSGERWEPGALSDPEEEDLTGGSAALDTLRPHADRRPNAARRVPELAATLAGRGFKGPQAARRFNAESHVARVAVECAAHVGLSLAVGSVVGAHIGSTEDD